MAKIGTVAANSTAVFTLDYLPERIQFQDIDPINIGFPMTGEVDALTVVHSGQQLCNLTADRVVAMAEIGGFFTGAENMMQWLELAKGRKNGATNITVKNRSLNDPLDVYAVSSGFSELVCSYVEGSVNPNSNQSFRNFEWLYIGVVFNIQRVNITFKNGFNDDFSPNELTQLVGLRQNTPGLFTSGNSGLMISGEDIESLTVFFNGIGSTVFAVKQVGTI